MNTTKWKMKPIVRLKIIKSIFKCTLLHLSATSSLFWCCIYHRPSFLTSLPPHCKSKIYHRSRSRINRSNHIKHLSFLPSNCIYCNIHQLLPIQNKLKTWSFLKKLYCHEERIKCKIAVTGQYKNRSTVLQLWWLFCMTWSLIIPFPSLLWPAKASTSDLGDQTSRALRSVHAYSTCWLSRKLTVPIEKEPVQAGFWVS